MAASSRAQVLRLYRALLRESQRFSGYNYRTYAIRRIRDAFRENKNIKDSEKIEELVNKAKANLEIIHRQLNDQEVAKKLWLLKAKETFKQKDECIHAVFMLPFPTDLLMTSGGNNIPEKMDR
ncbi:LYR motif-containing protein 4 isoform X1 [Struthio camelus]|uniref:LYR motif-containing protein 4 isoform X1 n=1 Tax=Struthio camelus TaxID=8801 RepID=UPI003603B2B6